MTGQKARRVTKKDADIGFRIRQARQNKKLSQVKLAALLNISREQLRKCELGHNRVSADRLRLIATILDVDANELLHGANEMVPVVPVHLSPHHDLDQKAAKLWSEIRDNRHKDAILELMEILHNQPQIQATDVDTPDQQIESAKL